MYIVSAVLVSSLNTSKNLFEVYQWPYQANSTVLLLFSRELFFVERDVSQKNEGNLQYSTIIYFSRYMHKIAPKCESLSTSSYYFSQLKNLSQLRVGVFKLRPVIKFFSPRSVANLQFFSTEIDLQISKHKLKKHFYAHRQPR